MYLDQPKLKFSTHRILPCTYNPDPLSDSLFACFIGTHFNKGKISTHKACSRKEMRHLV